MDEAATPTTEVCGNSNHLINSPDYFESYEDLDVHRLMIQDDVRTNAYMNAIYNAKPYFEGKIVMDVGAGTGILSLFCAKAGAKKVYAVEASNLARVLPQVFEKNGFRNTVQVFHSKVEDVKLEEKVDIIISEWMGFYLLHESMLDSVLFARDNFLKPETGLLFPNTAQIYAAPCSIPELWENLHTFWETKHYDFDLSPFVQLSKLKTKPEIHLVNPDNILSDPQLLWEFDLSKADRNSLISLTDRRFFSIEQDGEIQGVCIWFSCGFPSSPEIEESTLPTGPWDPETHWKQTVIVCPNAVAVEAGDIIGWNFRMEKVVSTTDDRSYKIQLEFLDDGEEHPVLCDCGSVQCEIVAHYMRNRERMTNNTDATDVNNCDEAKHE